MREETIELLFKVGAALLSALALAGLSRCTTQSDVEQYADGTCNITVPREVTYKTYRSCGDECTETIRHAFKISSERDSNDKEIVTIHKSVIDPHVLGAKRTVRSFRYETNGPTLEASRTTQHSIIGYKTDPNTSSGDISVHSDGYITGDSHVNGYAQAMSLIRQIESRASCKMPKPAEPGVKGITFGPGGSSW